MAGVSEGRFPSALAVVVVFVDGSGAFGVGLLGNEGGGGCGRGGGGGCSGGARQRVWKQLL